MKGSNARYWVGVLYPENMIDNWQEEIGDILQLPFAYCVHDKDNTLTDEIRKVHVHLIVVFPNTTTYNHAFNLFSSLNAEGKVCVNTIQKVINIRHQYEYLIHNTETCKKKGKFLYDLKERISGNNFDIGAYEQISIVDKYNICKELCNFIVNENFTNFADFYMFVVANFDDSNYFDSLRSYSGFYERIIKGNYLKMLSEE